MSVMAIFQLTPQGQVDVPKYGITIPFNIACDRNVAFPARKECPNSSADPLEILLRFTNDSTARQSSPSGNLLATFAHNSTSSLQLTALS
jgi:hypothetical protein